MPTGRSLDPVGSGPSRRVSLARLSPSGLAHKPQLETADKNQPKHVRHLADHPYTDQHLTKPVEYKSAYLATLMLTQLFHSKLTLRPL